MCQTALSLFFSALILTSFVSCSSLNSQGTNTETASREKVSAGKFIESITISPKPDRLAIDHAHSQRKNIIIDMRSPREIQGDVAPLAREYGLIYYNVPFYDENNKINKKSITTVGDLAGQNPDKVIVHCSSGNRASAWLSLYLHNEYGWSLDRAIKAGESKRLTDRKLKQEVRNHEKRAN